MHAFADGLPAAPDRAPDFADDFRAADTATDPTVTASAGPSTVADRGLDPKRWVAHYLSHWTTPLRSEARYALTGAGLELRIEEDQLDWRPEDAPLRVSNVQTGSFAGPVGSDRGTHRHRTDGLLVRTATPTRLLFAPAAGRIDITLSASTDEGCMTAAWLIGTEHLSPEHSGEICLFEIDADAIGTTTTARVGIKAHHDPGLTPDMTEVTLPLDASTPHTWTVIWGDGETVIGCEGRILRRIPQAPDYALFLMVDLFELRRTAGPYPKRATVHSIRGWMD
jgi:hypothetical protein